MAASRPVRSTLIALVTLAGCAASTDMDPGAGGNNAAEADAQHVGGPVHDIEPSSVARGSTDRSQLNSSSVDSSLGGEIRLQRAATDGSQLCVDIIDQSTVNGARAEVWTCNQQKNQAFVFAGKLVKVYGNKCLNVVDRNDANGTEIQIWDCSEQDPAMLWNFRDGHLRWNGSDKCLDVKDGVFQKGARLQLWACNETSPNQLFTPSRDQVTAGAAATPEEASTPSSPAPTGSSASPTSTRPTPTTSSSGTTLRLSAWQQEVWRARAFNNEQQSYTNNGANVSFAGDGTATLSAKPTGGSSWTSARLSGDVMGPLPWYLEADLVAPTGKGSWPAFWLTSRGSWPQGGEIDIMEQVNGAQQSHISTHWGPTTGNATFNTHEIIDNFNGGERHRYGVWVTEQGLQFYLDGRIVGGWVAFPAQSDFVRIASQMVPIVNVAMGGDWPGSAPQASGEQKMVVYRVSRDVRPPRP